MINNDMIYVTSMGDLEIICKPLKIQGISYEKSQKKIPPTKSPMRVSTSGCSEICKTVFENLWGGKFFKENSMFNFFIYNELYKSRLFPILVL